MFLAPANESHFLHRQYCRELLLLFTTGPYCTSGLHIFFTTWIVLQGYSIDGAVCLHECFNVCIIYMYVGIYVFSKYKYMVLMYICMHIFIYLNIVSACLDQMMALILYVAHSVCYIINAKHFLILIK